MSLSDLILSSTTSMPSDEALPGLLKAIRQHLGLDVAFIAEFTDGKRIFRHVDPADPSNPVQAGAGDPLEQTYCQRVVDGRLPELMCDASQNAVAAALPVTQAVPVGAHLSVPIWLADGSIYGTFCCFSFGADTSLRERDLQMLRVFAQVASKMIDWERATAMHRSQIEQRIRKVLEGDALSIVYQPIYNTIRHTVVGFEALSRFAIQPARPPDVWFGEANAAGLGEQLEERAITLALQGLPRLSDDTYLAVNLSPEHVFGDGFPTLFGDAPLDRIVLEITEHAVVEHYDRLAHNLQPLRARGMRIAVDDAGAGYASFRHILNLAPDRIKLDMSITRNIDTDRSRRALAAALIRFSEETGSSIVAEGVETEAELKTLQHLGVEHLQGNLLGQAVPLHDAARMAQPA